MAPGSDPLFSQYLDFHQTKQMTTHGSVSDLFVHKTTTLSQFRPPVGLTNGTPRVNKCLAAEMFKLGLILKHSHKVLRSGWQTDRNWVKIHKRSTLRDHYYLLARVLLLKVLRSYFYSEFGRHASPCLGRYCHSLDYRE